jgi:hypothetical protein
MSCRAPHPHTVLCQAGIVQEVQLTKRRARMSEAGSRNDVSASPYSSSNAVIQRLAMDTNLSFKGSHHIGRRRLTLIPAISCLFPKDIGRAASGQNDRP